jgi:DNA-binding transcriptional ArsR family regulator
LSLLNRLVDVNRGASTLYDWVVAVSRREATQDEARALANPIRLRILRLLRDGSQTNAEIAARLELQPATTLHHVRTLVRTGFVAPDRERPGPNGITEKPYRDTGKSWTVNITDPTAGGRIDSAVLEAFTAEVAEVGGQLETSTRLALNLNDASFQEFTSRLAALLDEFDQRDDPDGSAYALFLAVHRRTRRRGQD